MNKTPQHTLEASDQTTLPWLEKYFIRDSYIKVSTIVLAFCILGFLIYSNTFQSPFVFDDKARILENPDIRVDQLTVDRLWKAAFGKQSPRSRPIGNISFALNYYFHQYELAGYHTVNIIIHVLCGILLWFFLKQTFSLKTVRPHFAHGEWIALLAALLWLVNPVQTQSVTYIVQRLNSMAAMFFLISFLCYLNGRLAAKSRLRWTWFGGALLTWLLALGCKQNTAMLPFLIFLYEWYFFRDLSKDWLKRNLKYVMGILIILFFIALAYTGFNPLEKLSRLNDFAKNEFTLTQRILTQPRVVIYFISLWLFPHPSRLNIDYDFPLSYSLLNPPATLLSLSLIIGLLAAAGYLARKQRLISFGLLWFFGNLVIESSIVPLAIIFEHRMYLPSMLLGLIPVLLVFRYVKLNWLCIGLLCIVAALFSLWTYERNQVWQSKITLWQDSIQKSPNKARPHYNLGEAYANLDMPDKAIPPLMRSLEIDPDNAPAHHNLALILAAQGKTDEAIAHYRKALQINPNSPESHQNLGVALSKQNHLDEAIEHYLIALQLKPDNAETQFALGEALARQGKTEQSIHHLNRAVQIKPDHAEAHNNLGGQLLSQGKLDEALEHLNRAVAIDPQLAEPHSNIGIIMIRQGNLDAAISHFQAAIRIDPEFKPAHNNLQRALAIRDSMNSEIGSLQKELESKPDDPELHFKMGNFYLGQKNLHQAIAEYEKALALQPAYPAARNNLALAYAADRQYDRALAAFKNLIALDPDNPSIDYNIAVLYALQNNVAESVAWLKQAIDRGYRNWDLIKTDKDLANIRDSHDYQLLVEGH